MRNNIIKQMYNKIFKYSPTVEYNFSINPKANSFINIPTEPEKNLEPQNFFTDITKNLDFFKSKYNSLICNDIVIRDFVLTAQNKEYKASIIYIDGMVDTQSITDSILRPLMLRNKANTYTNDEKEIISEFTNNDVIIRKIKKFNLGNYIYNHLVPENSVSKIEKFDDAISRNKYGKLFTIN